MYCKNCGKEIPEGAQFCQACGFSMTGVAPAHPGALSEADEKYIKGWSWGGFFGHWVFLFVHKQKNYGWRVLLMYVISFILGIIPFTGLPVPTSGISGLRSLVGIIILGIILWLGIRGREIVWKSGVYSTVEDMKKRQKLATKLTIAYILAFLIIYMGIIFTVAKKYVGHPELIDQQIMQQALTNAKSKDPNLVETDFKDGYSAGKVDGPGTSTTPTFIQDKDKSFQEGYTYGYGVSCMQKYNDKMTCTKNLLGALGIKQE
jgi:hypothetical protein